LRLREIISVTNTQIAYTRSFCWMLICACALAMSTLALSNDEPAIDINANELSQADAAIDAPVLSDTQEAQLKQLNYVQSVLSRKLAERRELGDRLVTANELDKADMRRAASTLSSEIVQLRTTLESIATGGIDRKLFEEPAQEKKKDWREDVSLIAQPVLDSLKELTEKPRRIKELNELIDLKNQEIAVSQQALDNISGASVGNDDAMLNASIEGLTNKWQKRLDDANSTIEIAQIQLSNFEGDQPLSTTIFTALKNFAQGRGLTILLAIAAAVFVLMSVRMILKVYRHILLDKRQPTSRTRYRVAKYSTQALTFTLVLTAVFVVFYERADVLLLGLLILLIVGFVLNAKQLLPRYLKEARLLLNLGAMREGERVVHNGLPYRVESINMYTVFRNPELDGIIRIPLAELTKTWSRPVSSETWFPTSTGDVILTSDNVLLQVLNQNPDTVELKKRGGELLSIPATDFYAMSMTNLSRHGTYGVTSTFGIDYNHQAICISDIPQQFQEGVMSLLKSSNLDDAVQEVRVELKDAGNSSINYWIFVTMDSSSAFSYQRVERIIQTACIKVCTEHDWTIPFPHMSVVQKDTPLIDNSDSQVPFGATG